MPGEVGGARRDMVPASPVPDSAPERRARWGWIPPLLAVLPFLPLLDAPRLVDERVLAHEAIKWIGLDPLAPWQLPIGGSGTWRPLSVYLFRLDAGAPALVAHALNLGLHAAAVALLHRWLRLRLGAAAALVGACWFAVHPAHVATAGWIAGRADGAMVVAALGALLAWQRSRWLLCGLLAATAVLFKETGVALVPMLALLALHDRRGGRALLAAALGGGGALLTTFALTRVADSYLPWHGLGLAARWLPPYALELVAPGFVPVGVPEVTRDLVGLLGSVLVVGWFVQLGAVDRTWRLGLGLAAVALLPVAHVLSNDGGQWYLLLPSVGAALAWGALAERTAGVRVLVAVMALLACVESVAWRQASLQVDAQIEAHRTDRVAPPRQDPRDWPHRGPSFCCGLPYQLYDDPTQ